MTIFKRYVAILVATLTVGVSARWLLAQEPAQRPTVKSLTEVLKSDASTFEKAEACRKINALGDKEAVPALAALLTDEKLAGHARSALENIADPSAAAALRDALGRTKGTLRAGVVNSLGMRRDIEAVGVLQKLAADRSSGVSGEALAALGRIATPDAVATLRQSLNAASPEDRSAAAHACLDAADRWISQNKRSEAVALLDHVLAAEPSEPIPSAATYSAILARQAADLSLLRRELKAESQSRFDAAIRAARRMPGKEMTQAIPAELGQLSPARQAVVLEALAERNDAAILPAVQKAAASESIEVRRAAFRVLGRMGDASTMQLLVEGALSDHADLAQTAKESLLVAKAQGLDAALIARLAQASPKERVVLSDILGERKATAAVDTIARLADDSSDAVRAAAVQALGRILPPDDIHVLLNRLEKAQTPKETLAIRQAVRATSARASDLNAYAKKLHAHMAKSPLAAQCFLLELIGRLGSRESLTIVAQCARDKRPEIQDAATRELGGWMNVDAAPVLLDLAKTLNNEKLQVRTLRGYLRIARQLNLSTDQRLAMCEAAFHAAIRYEEKRLAVEVAEIATKKDAAAAQKTRAEALRKKLPAQKDGAGNKTNASAKKVVLFDGRTFNGWEGDTAKSFRIEDGAIVGGNPSHPIPRNEFLCTKHEYADFVLRVECKIKGPCNGGIQFRSARIPNNFEVSGYQADMSAGADGGYWGCLYDESRRNRILVKAAPESVKKALKPNDWNLYEIRCEGPRIRLSINGIPTADYTETDAKIPAAGILGLQIHGGPASEAWYRNITLEELR